MMAPIRTYTNWNMRYSQNVEQIEPFRHYYFICEGKNTEKWYFEKLIDIRKELNIHSQVDVVYLEKTEGDKNLSNPEQLIDFADKQKDNKSINFDPKFDKMVVVFDADVFETQLTNYDEVVKKGEKRNILGITNPSFELFLLLHYENTADQLIIPDQARIIANDWVGGTSKNTRRRYIEEVFRNKSSMKPKKDKRIGELAHNVRIAIEQEKKLNNDIHTCKGIVTCNIGQIIDAIINDKAV